MDNSLKRIYFFFHAVWGRYHIYNKFRFIYVWDAITILLRNNFQLKKKELYLNVHMKAFKLRQSYPYISKYVHWQPYVSPDARARMCTG